MLTTTEVNLAITTEQLLAMAHAAQSNEPVAMGLAKFNDDGTLPLSQRGLVIEFVDSKGWLFVNYQGNVEGQGVYLTPDGGWRYGPGEPGYYPWKE